MRADKKRKRHKYLGEIIMLDNKVTKKGVATIDTLSRAQTDELYALALEGYS